MAHGRPDFSPTAVDVMLRPEWAAKEGTDKNFRVGGLLPAYGNTIELNYAVPVGKNLYITQYSFQIFATAAADADKDQVGSININDSTAPTYFIYDGGHGGSRLSMNKPIVIPGGDTFNGTLASRTNHASYGALVCQGYEI